MRDADKHRVIIIAVIMAFTLIGNMTLILVLLCKRSRRIKRVNILLMNLAIGDLAVALFVNSTEIFFIAFGDWALGPLMCKISVYVQMICLSSTTNLLTSMSIDRYQVIVKPMQSLAKRPRIWLKIAISWILSLIFPIPQLFIFVQYNDGVKFDGSPRRICGSNGYTAPWQRKVYFTFTTVYILVVPMVIMLYCYVKIIRVVWVRAKNESRRDDMNPGSPRMSVRRSLVTASKRRALIMTLSVVMSFLICHTPYFFINLVRIYSDYQVKLDTIKVLEKFLVMVHSTLNPILYGLFTLRQYHLKYLIAFVTCTKRPATSTGTKHRQYSDERHQLLDRVRSRLIRHTSSAPGTNNTSKRNINREPTHSQAPSMVSPADVTVVSAPSPQQQGSSSTFSILNKFRFSPLPSLHKKPKANRKGKLNKNTLLFANEDAIHLKEQHRTKSEETEPSEVDSVTSPLSQKEFSSGSLIANIHIIKTNGTPPSAAPGAARVGARRDSGPEIALLGSRFSGGECDVTQRHKPVPWTPRDDEFIIGGLTRV
ncbi:neuropeptide S receptor-like [Physella acuta]|uniref:neuropeptide S receptor-like n=1 Tax=Physella acuta TaxID=109671 RepID=UPI0027DE3814|nr:neuropeptide S receptor-like [Physella acuta]